MGLFVAFVHGQRRTREELERLAKQLSGRLVAPPEGLSRLDGVAIRRGSLADRRVDVSFVLERIMNSTRLFAQVDVEVREPPPGFRVRPRKVAAQILGWVRGEATPSRIGDARLDQAYRVEGNPEALRGLIGKLAAQEALAGIMGEGYEGQELHLIGSLLRVKQMRPASLDRLLEIARHLVTLARHLDRKQVEVEALGPSVHFVLTGGGDQALCPYCRDDLDLTGELALTECSACSTIHHAECLQEAGGCTVLGCGGRGQEREGRPPGHAKA